MKDLSTGVAAFLRLTDRPDEILAPIALSLFKRVMGDITTKLFPIRYRKGTLFLSAIDDSWLREGKRRSKIICSTINNTAGFEIVEKVILEKGELSAEKPNRKPVKEKKAIPAPPKELINAAASIKDVRVRRAFLKLGTIITSNSAGRQHER